MGISIIHYISHWSGWWNDALIVFKKIKISFLRWRYLSFIISVIGQGAEMMLLSWLNFENIVLEQASIPYTSEFPD